MVFGERGVGKTSFANIICTKLSNVTSAKITCNRDDNFKQLWRRALAKIKFSTDAGGARYTAEVHRDAQQLDMFLPSNDDIDSLDIQHILEKVQGNLLFVFDEYDSLTDSKVRSKFADTIKNLSDNAPNVTIGLVGIADDVAHLIGEHPSIERCLKQIKMPKMSSVELEAILEKGLQSLAMGIEPAIKRRIVYFSSGFPHYTHLLGKYSARECINSEENVIADKHYREALEHALRDANQSIRNAYQLATIDAKKRKSRFSKVIDACAVADEDEYGTFALRDIVEPYNRISGEKVKAQNLAYNVQKLCDSDKGSILTKVGDSNNIRFRFNNPLMKVYVRMKLDKTGNQPTLFS